MYVSDNGFHTCRKYGRPGGNMPVIISKTVSFSLVNIFLIKISQHSIEMSPMRRRLHNVTLACRDCAYIFYRTVNE